jgi:hypothetical protein
VYTTNSRGTFDWVTKSIARTVNEDGSKKKIDPNVVVPARWESKTTVQFFKCDNCGVEIKNNAGS